MFNVITKKKKQITNFGFVTGMLFLILLDIENNNSLVFVFGIMFLLLNCLKNIYYIEGMKTII